MPATSVSDVRQELEDAICQEVRNKVRIEGIEKLPAVQWKLMNIKKIGEKKRKELLEKLRRVLGM